MGFFVIITDDILTKERVNYMGFFQLIFDQFKKDDGAHFTHNLGVSFLRIGVIAIILSIICAAYYKIQPDSQMTLDPKSKVVYTNVECKQRKYRYTHRGRTKTRTRKYYYAHFICVNEKDEEFEINYQPISRKQYSEYRHLTKFDNFKIYDAQKLGVKYATPKTGKAALNELHENSPTMTALMVKNIGFILMIAGLFMSYKGIREKKLAKEYKRADYVPTQEEVRKSQEKDDIMREFDEAYKRKYGCEPENNTRKSYRKH